MEVMNVEKRLRELIAKHCRVNGGQIGLDERFMNDLGADSLDLVELLIDVENAFRLYIPREDAHKILTLRKAIAVVEKNLDSRSHEK